MLTNWLIGMSFPAGIAFLVWLLMRDVRKETERHPRRWWQKKKRKMRSCPTRLNDIPPVGGIMPPPNLPSTSPHCGDHHYGGGGDCGGF